MANGESAVPVTVDLGGWLQNAWEYFIEDALPWCLIGLLYFAVLGVLSQIPIIGWIGLLVLSGPLAGGLFYAAFARMRGTRPTVGMLFAPMQTDFLQLSLVGLVGGLLTALIATVTCGLGLLVVFPLWMFAVPLVLERRLPFWDALELSRTTVQPHLTQWILFGLVCMAVMAAGSLVVGLGVIATIPIGFLMVAVAYHEVFGIDLPVTDSAPPPPHPPAQPSSGSHSVESPAAAAPEPPAPPPPADPPEPEAPLPPETESGTAP